MDENTIIFTADPVTDLGPSQEGRGACGGCVTRTDTHRITTTYALTYVVVQTKKKHPRERTRWLTSDMFTTLLLLQSSSQVKIF